MGETLLFMAFWLIISLLITRELVAGLILWALTLAVWYGALLYIYMIVEHGGHLTI